MRKTSHNKKDSASKKLQKKTSYNALNPFHKKIDEILQRQEQKYYFLFEKNSHPMWIFDKKTFLFLDVNKAAINKYGYSKKEFLRMKIQDILVAQDIPSLMSFIKKIKNNSPRNFQQTGEWSHVKKNGTIMLVQITRNSIFFEGKNAILVSIHDITKRKIAEEKLQESEKKYRKLIEYANDPILLIDCDDEVIIDANKKAENFLESNRKEIIGIKHSEIHPKEKLAKHKKEIQEALKKGHLTYESKIKTKKGKVVPVEISVNIIELNNRKIIQCIIRDMTKHQQIDALKTEFISVASHELKTPITTIKLLISALRKKSGKTANDKYYDSIENEINRLTDLINELLDLSRIESNKLNLTFEFFDLNKLTSNVVTKMRLVSNKRKLIFKSKNKINVLGDQARIEQVLVNFLTNAIKHSHTNGQIIIELDNTNKKNVTVSVADQGEGIPESALPHIFDRFYQAKKSEEKSGFGLGLYIAKGIIEQHKGKIWAKSKQEKGSTFYFSLPLHKTSSKIHSS